MLAIIVDRHPDLSGPMALCANTPECSLFIFICKALTLLKQYEYAYQVVVLAFELFDLGKVAVADAEVG